MKLSLNVIWLGEIANLELEFGHEDEPVTATKIAEKAVGEVSKWWLGKLFKP